MSEAEKERTVQTPNDPVETDEISTNELDTVAGGVLALQQLESGEAQPEGGLTSAYSVGCTCDNEPIGS